MYPIIFYTRRRSEWFTAVIGRRQAAAPPPGTGGQQAWRHQTPRSISRTDEWWTQARSTESAWERRESRTARYCAAEHISTTNRKDDYDDDDDVNDN